MSIDIIARALASQAGNNATTAQSSANAASQRAGSIDLFANIASRAIDASVNLVSTGGYSGTGQGAARYVSDALATSGLAASYPLLCKQSADGRYWRALADADGLVPLAAAGVIGFAVPTFTTNQQPAIQQVIDYCFAVGAAGARAEDWKHYCAWAPTRTASDANVNTDKTGIPFLINRNAASCGYFKLRGIGSKIWRRMQGGADPATVGTWQTLSGGWKWRGGMFFLCGATSAPASYAARTTLHLDGVELMGGIPFVSPGFYDGVNGFNASTGQGWDITDKPVWAENDRYTGDIIFTNGGRIDGFGGEMIYQGGGGHGSVYQSGGTLEISNSGGDGFNPAPTYAAESGAANTGTVQLESIRIRKSFQALEGATGWNGRIGSLVIEDCDRGGGLMAGVWWQATQPTGLAFPTLMIGQVRAERCGYFIALRGNRIAQALLVDSYCQIAQANIAAYGIDIAELEVQCDRSSLAAAVTFTGTSTSGSKGTYQNHIRHLRCSQSDYALANTKRVSNACDYGGSLGDQNFIHKITGYAVCPPSPSGLGSVTDYHVGFGDLSSLSYQNPGHIQNVETTPLIALSDAVMWVNNTSSSGVFPYTLPNMTGKLPLGARRWVQTQATGTSVFAMGTTNTPNSASVIHKHGLKIEIEWNYGGWNLVRPAQAGRLSAASTITWSSIANTATSAEQTMTLAGVKVASPGAWRVFAISSLSTWPASVVLNARISADNTVAISATNVSGASVTPPVGTITVYAEPLA